MYLPVYVILSGIFMCFSFLSYVFIALDEADIALLKTYVCLNKNSISISLMKFSKI